MSIIQFVSGSSPLQQVLDSQQRVSGLLGGLSEVPFVFGQGWSAHRRCAYLDSTPSQGRVLMLKDRFETIKPLSQTAIF